MFLRLYLWSNEFDLQTKNIFKMKTKKISISDFTFVFSSYGHYKVTYRSPITFKEWTRTIDNMPLIDATKNAEEPRRKDLEELKRLVKA